MYKLFTDGGSRGNPGHAAIGCVIWEDDVLKDFDMKYIGIATNNIAEYRALEMGVSKLRKLGVSKLDIYMDSELVVKQIKGEYAVKDGGIRVEYSKIMTALKDFKEYTINYIPREKNKLADKLVNMALDVKLEQ